MNLIDKYRPQKLADILGQDWIVRQLSLFAAKPHSAAFLFEGSTGVGKTSAAMALAGALGVAIDQDEIGGLWQIASGEQTGQTVRRAVDNLRVRPWAGSGWKVLVVNECDCITDNAAMVWLDVLESLPPMTVIVFTTNAPDKIPRRLRDRCERFAFESGGLFMRPVAQDMVNRVWLAETGRADAPDIDALGQVADEKGDVSLRRVLQLLQPFARAGQAPPKPTVQQPAAAKIGPGTLREKVYNALAEQPLSRAELKDRLQCEVGSTISGLLRAGAIEKVGSKYIKSAG